MKTKFSRLFLLAACSIFAACQSQHDTKRDPARFEHDTSEEMNPVTREFEQAPPYGPRSNKPDR